MGLRRSTSALNRHRRRRGGQARAATTDSNGGDAQGGQAQQGTQSPFRIAAEDLAPLKARILLMLALTATKDGPQIQRMFGEY